jgi:chromosome segregation ATPase
MQQPVSNAPAPISRPSFDWSGQQQMPRGAGGEDPAARAERLTQLVLQMEAKQAKTEAELRDCKAKHSGLATRLEAQEAENDNLRENLSRLSRGHPATMDTESSDEQARMTVALKRENQMYRQQLDDLSKRNEILQRSIQHSEKQQQGMSGENANLMLRLQGAEQRTDQLMKQKSTMDSELLNLRSQLAAQQQQLATQEHEFRHQMQLRDRDAHKSLQELKDLLAQQQAEFEKQRVLMVHQRDGVQKVFEQDLNEIILKNQQLEADLAKVSFLPYVIRMNSCSVLFVSGNRIAFVSAAILVCGMPVRLFAIVCWLSDILDDAGAS